MKTPDEIKNKLMCGLAQVDGRCEEYVACVCCPFFSEARDPEDILAYIQQLERERDAAVEDMKKIAHSDYLCDTCAHYAFDEEDEPRICADCDVETYSNWQWRGVQEVE